VLRHDHGRWWTEVTSGSDNCSAHLAVTTLSALASVITTFGPARLGVCAGPTWATPTKPGRPAAGLELLRHAARLTGPDSRPWFAIGGIETIERLDDVIAAGARRVVVVRAITQAEDPGEIARTFASRLFGVPPSPS